MPGKRFLLKRTLLLLFVAVSVGLEGRPLQVESLETIEVNGSKQWVLIRTADPANPVLLYLHGGPGESLIPFAHVATSRLTDDATVVYWDQRGAGLSFDAANPPETLNIQQLVRDTHAVTAYLKNRFHAEKIYLAGHSWGSILGTLVAKKYPEDYYAYIGIGQVISQRCLDQGRLEWLLTDAAPLLTAEDSNELRALKPWQPVSIRYVRKYRGFIHNITDAELGQVMARSPYRAEAYTTELYEKGSELSRTMLSREMNDMDFLKDACELQLPAYYFLGKYDYVTPTKPVVEYVKKLRAPSKRIVWFESSGHRMDVEEPEKFQAELARVLGVN